MKCALCDEEFDENMPSDHMTVKHTIPHSFMMKYILALQKRIEDLEHKVQQHHEGDHT